MLRGLPVYIYIYMERRQFQCWMALRLHTCQSNENIFAGSFVSFASCKKNCALHLSLVEPTTHVMFPGLEVECYFWIWWKIFGRGAARMVMVWWWDVILMFGGSGEFLGWGFFLLKKLSGISFRSFTFSMEFCSLGTTLFFFMLWGNQNKATLRKTRYSNMSWINVWCALE